MKIEVSKSPSSLLIVEQSSKALGVLAAAMLFMSVFYDFSYLFALGLSFDDIPSIIAEHVRSALLWGPIAVLSVFIFAGHELLEWRERDRLPESFMLRRQKRLLKHTKTEVVVILLFSTPIIGIFRGIGWIYLAGCVVFTALMIYIVFDELLRKKVSESRVFFGVVLPLPVIFMFIGFYGYVQGESLGNSVIPSWELSIRIGTTITKRTVTGLRRFSTFAIIVDREHYVSIIPNDSILEAKRLKKVTIPQSNMCLWFNLRCDPPEMPVPAPEPTRVSRPATVQPSKNIGPVVVSH